MNSKKNGSNEQSTGSDEREAANVNRNDFWATTSNKQLNFVQHIHSLLKRDGRAAVVVPENVNAERNE